MSERDGILCFGEILWDGLPSALYLGGAPLNVCYHLSRFDIPSGIAGRVGADRLGREAVKRIARLGIPTDLIQQDPDHETGFVSVDLTPEGDPEYTFVEPAAWDYIAPTDPLERRIRESWGVVFGTLAQRSDVTRATIRQLWELEVKKILDMNIRRPYLDRGVIEQSMAVADIVKMNEEELALLKEWYRLDGSNADAVPVIAERFDNETICVTLGKDGAQLFKEGVWHEHPGYPVTTKDAVGAGDAFLAALLYGIRTGREDEQLLPFANATGALVAQRDGATPEYSVDEILDGMG